MYTKKPRGREHPFVSSGDKLSKLPTKGSDSNTNDKDDVDNLPNLKVTNETVKWGKARHRKKVECKVVVDIEHMFISWERTDVKHIDEVYDVEEDITWADRRVVERNNLNKKFQIHMMDYEAVKRSMIQEGVKATAKQISESCGVGLSKVQKIVPRVKEAMMMFEKSPIGPEEGR